MTPRAQAFTLEAFVASLLLLGSVAFALQATGVTTNTPSASSGQVEGQLEDTATGVLDAAARNGSLRPTVLYWNETAGRFHGADRGHYVGARPPTRFGALLDRTLGGPDRAFNVDVRYVSSTGEIRERSLVRYGAPSDHAVRAVETVTLSDGDRLYDADGTRTNTTLAESSDFYAPDAAPDSPVYNVVRVEVVVWYV